jgi:hypothetical protein
MEMLNSGQSYGLTLDPGYVYGPNHEFEVFLVGGVIMLK